MGTATSVNSTLAPVRPVREAQPSALYRAAQALQQAVPPQGDGSPRLWLSGFLAALRACREAVELHERRTRGNRMGPGPVGSDEHSRGHEELRSRIAGLVRSARQTPLDDAERLGELRTEGILIAGKLMAHHTRAEETAFERAGGRTMLAR